MEPRIYTVRAPQVLNASNIGWFIPSSSILWRTESVTQVAGWDLPKVGAAERRSLHGDPVRKEEDVSEENGTQRNSGTGCWSDIRWFVRTFIVVVLLVLALGVLIWFLQTKGDLSQVSVQVLSGRAASDAVDDDDVGTSQVCAYRASYLEEFGKGEDPNVGIVQQASSRITGPAIAQLDVSRAVAIYPGASWTATARVVVWEYTGSIECLEAQFPFFPGKSIQKVR